MLDDPRLNQLRHAFAGRPAAAVARSADTKEAAVALVVRPHEELELLLIKRAELHGDPWSGHVALPGGRRASADADLVITAIRETSEEVGVEIAHRGTFIGALDEVAPSTPRLPPLIIAPFVFGVGSDTAAHPNPREVQAAMWIPLSALRDAAAMSEIEVQHNGATFSLPSLVYGDHVIWGLTYRILQQFLEIVELRF